MPATDVSPARLMTAEYVREIARIAGGSCRIGVDLGRLDGGPHPVARSEDERIESGGRDLSDERDVAVEADADAVGLAVDVGDGGSPDVARAAFRCDGVEGDGMRLDDGIGGS